MVKHTIFGIGGVFIFIICILAITVTIRFGGLYIERFFAPKEQSVQRQVFEETKSYVYGSIRDIAKYHEEYLKADKKEKRIIANIVKERFPNFDPDKIHSYTLRQWFVAVRGY